MIRNKDTSIDDELRKSQESLEFALESGRMYTWDINLTNDTVQCSPGMLALWGVAPGDFHNQRSILQSKVHPDDVGPMREAINFAIKNKSIYEFEYRIYPQPEKEVWVMSRGRCTFAKDSDTPVRFAGVVFDITERKLKEKTLNDALKAREEFFMIAGHELKTPLTCLQLQLDVLQWELKYKDTEVFSIERIEVGLQKQREHLLRVTRIVDNMVDEKQVASGWLPLELEEFDLNEMVRDVLESFKLTASSLGIRVELVSETNIRGKWDRFRLEQVLINLLTNAIRFGKRKPIEVKISKEGKTSLLSVRDNGLGIKPEDHKRIFDRFVRTNGDPEAHGMGLGLFICDGIIRAHGGEIRVQSEPHVGSEFTVVLPS